MAQRVLTTHLVAGGRLLLGVGAGSTATDFAALGLDFAARFRRLDESLGVMRGMSVKSAALWVTDLNALPSKEAPDVTQKLSTGSVRRRTSTPRARKPSRCGEASRRAMSSPAT